jgi:hypothetical protein
MARRPRTWVVDLRHYLSEETEDLAEMPGPVLNCAMFFASIVAWATDHSPAGDPHTNIWCMRRPGRKRCLGEIQAELRSDSMEIVWDCPWCGENGVIRGWEDTLWDRRPAADGDGRSLRKRTARSRGAPLATAMRCTTIAVHNLRPSWRIGLESVCPLRCVVRFGGCPAAPAACRGPDGARSVLAGYADRRETGGLRVVDPATVRST